MPKGIGYGDSNPTEPSHRVGKKMHWKINTGYRKPPKGGSGGNVVEQTNHSGPYAGGPDRLRKVKR